MTKLFCAAIVTVGVLSNVVQLESQRTNVCRGVPNEYTVAHFSNARQYFRCVNGASQLLECTSGMVFNSASGFCHVPSNQIRFHYFKNGPGNCGVVANGDNRQVNNECDVFEECRNGRFIANFCPDGLYFNAKTGYCDQLSNEHCRGQCRGRANAYTFAHSRNSSKYWTCTDGLPVVAVCEFRLVFNANTRGCVNVRSGRRSMNCENGVSHLDMVPDHEACDSYYRCESGALIRKFCSNDSVFDPVSKLCVLPILSTCLISMNKLCRDVPHGYNTADPQNSRRYVTCQGANSVRLICPDAMIFNRKTGFCDLVVNALRHGPTSVQQYAKSLALPNLITKATTFRPIDIVSTTSRVTTIRPTAATVTTLPLPLSSSDDPDETCMLHPNNYAIRVENSCTKYMMCIFGEPHHLTCPPSLIFNPHIGACDFRENYSCESSRAGRILVSNEVHTICSMLPHGTFLPHETSCDKYYYCQKGVPKIRSCPGDFTYNRYIGECDWDEDSKCGAASERSEFSDAANEMNEPGICNGAAINTHVPSKISCDSYYLCESSGAVLKTCPLGMAFDQQRIICDFADGASNVSCN